MKHLLPALFAMLALSQQASATNVSGYIGGTVTWSKANSPYNVTGNVLVGEDATLIIEPGVEVRFADWINFNVDGAIQAIGTDAEPIVFKPNGSTTAPYAWKGIVIRGSNTPDSVVFDYCHFQRASNGIQAGGGYVSVTNCTATDCYKGFYISTIDGAFLGGNTIKQCFMGIHISKKGIVSGNKVAHTTEEGIYAVEDVSIVDNYVHDCGKGITYGSVYGPYACEIAGNTVVNVKEAGFLLHASLLPPGSIHNNLSVHNGIGYELHMLGGNVYNNTALHNETGVKMITTGANFTFKQNCIDSSINYNIWLAGKKDQDISGNYWGTTDSATLEVKMYDFIDSFDYPRGHILPVLSQPGSYCKQYTGPVVTGISDTKTNSAFITLSPNPFTNSFTINLQGKASKLAVFNMAGQQVYNADVKGRDKMAVDMSAYPAGVYHYRVTLTDNTIAAGKLVKQ